MYAAYVNLTSSIGKNFGYAIGLRGESSQYSGDLLNTHQHFSHNYPLSLFPSIFLSEKLGGNNELPLSATRKINRPNFFQLLPYTDYTDTLNITRGKSPTLVPEFERFRRNFRVDVYEDVQTQQHLVDLPPICHKNGHPKPDHALPDKGDFPTR